MRFYKIDLNENLKINLKLSFSNKLIWFPVTKQTCEVNNTMPDTIKVTKSVFPVILKIKPANEICDDCLTMNKDF